jgi:hypothetical protein
MVRSDGDNTSIGTDTAHPVRFMTNNTERMRIDSSGNVGIGTSSPSSTLDVNGTVTSDGLTVDTTSPFMSFRESGSTKLFIGASSVVGGGSGYYDFYSVTGLGQRFFTNSVEAMRIDSSGNLLVGKTAVNNDDNGFLVQPNGNSWFTATGNYPLGINRKTSDGALITFTKDQATVGSIGAGNTNRLYIGRGDTGIMFDANNNAIYPWDTSTNGVPASDQVNLGYDATGLKFKDLYLSGGVYLGGTGSANKLDDYEEGTWTPVDFYGAVSFTVYEAYYTKIGRKVFFELGIVIASNSNSNTLRIDGLPFTALAGSDDTGGAFVVSTNSGRSDLFLVSRNNDFINCITNSNVDVSISNYSNKQLKLNGSYITA